MIEQKLFGIDQRPNQVLPVSVRGVAGFSQVVERGLEFLWTRLAREGGEVQLADFRFGRFVFFREAFGSAGGGGELGFQFACVEQVQALREARRLDPFAFTDALGFGATEDAQELGRGVVAVVGEGDRSRSRREVREVGLRSRQPVDRVEQDFGLKASRVVARVVLTIDDVVLVGDFAQLIGS